MTTPEIRYVFYISDSTGLTVEAMGRSVLAQFDGEFVEETLAFVDDPEKAAAAVRTVREISEAHLARPIVFCTFANEALAKTIKECGALTLDCLENFIQPLAKELGRAPLHVSSGRYSAHKPQDYARRIDAVNYALGHDDGISLRDFSKADVILIGVSRTGKTPTSLYMALHYGIFAANYPLVDEDLDNPNLPRPLVDYEDKLYGLSIDPQRLTQIRNQRRPGSKYANLDKCKMEVAAALRLFKHNSVPHLNVTERSVEELAAKIMQEAKLQRHL